MGLAHALAVAGVVLRQRHLALSLCGGQHNPGIQRQEHGRGIADGRAGGEVTAEGRRVADQARGELREQVAQQRDPALEGALHFGKRQGRADVDGIGTKRQPTEFLEPVDGQNQRRP